MNLLSLNHEDFGPGEENLPLLVDPTLKHFTISVSGEKPKIKVCLFIAVDLMYIIMVHILKRFALSPRLFSKVTKNYKLAVSEGFFCQLYSNLAHVSLEP